MRLLAEHVCDMRHLKHITGSKGHCVNAGCLHAVRTAEVWTPCSSIPVCSLLVSCNLLAINKCMQSSVVAETHARCEGMKQTYNSPAALVTWHQAALGAPGSAHVGSSGGRQPAHALRRLSRWSSRRTRHRAAHAGQRASIICATAACIIHLHMAGGTQIYLHKAQRHQIGGICGRGTWSSMSRSAVQTAELTLKPDPNDSCHRRWPRFTPWRLSTNDQAYLRESARISAAACV